MADVLAEPGRGASTAFGSFPDFAAFRSCVAASDCTQVKTSSKQVQPKPPNKAIHTNRNEQRGREEVIYGAYFNTFRDFRRSARCSA